MDIESLLTFAHLAEQLKCRTRHCVTSDGRTESVAEHSWRLALLAQLICSADFPQADAHRVVQMCLVHDLGEAVTGDIPTFEKTAKDESAERAVQNRLCAQLPEPWRSSLASLFDEIAAGETLEAKIFTVLDKMEALLQHNEAPLSSWLPLEYDLQRTYGTLEAAFSPALAALRERLKQDSEEKIRRGV